MFNYSKDTFSPKEKVAILFKEYDTLRTEIISRAGGGERLAAILAVLFAATLGWRATHGPDHIFWVAIGVLIGTGVLFLTAASVDITLISMRIVELEKKINELSGGDALLIWETSCQRRFGWLTRRFIWIARRNNPKLTAI